MTACESIQCVGMYFANFASLLFSHYLRIYIIMLSSYYNHRESSLESLSSAAPSKLVYKVSEFQTLLIDHVVDLYDLVPQLNCGHSVDL